MVPKHRLSLGMCLALLSGVVLVGGDSGAPCLTRAVAQQRKAGTQTQEKKLSHEETLRWIGEHKAWRRARKTKPIWARAVEAEEVGKDFPTADHAVERARAGYWLSVGVAGEPWFQTHQNIERKYERAGEEVRTFRFDAGPRTYRIYKPRAATLNWAAKVEGPPIAGFFIRPNYDPEHPLYSPAGGYVVRDDVTDPYRAKPSDVWLVQQGLFESTYELMP